MRGGAQSHLMRCADGHYYVVKFQTNPQHRRILVNELLGTRLASRLGLPTAPSSVTNTAVVSGGGETSAANDTTSDLTVVDGPSGPADFSIAAAATTATVNKGSKAAYILTLTPLNNIPFATAIYLGGIGGSAQWNCVPVSACVRNARSEAGYVDATAFYFDAGHRYRHEYQPPNDSIVCGRICLRNAAGWVSSCGAPPQEWWPEPGITRHRDPAIRTDGRSVLWVR